MCSVVPADSLTDVGPLEGEVILGRGAGSRLSSSSGSSYDQSIGGGAHGWGVNVGGTSGGGMRYGGSHEGVTMGGIHKEGVSAEEYIPTKIPNSKDVEKKNEAVLQTPSQTVSELNTPINNSTVSTPGGTSLLPNPPPTPAGGVGGIPIPPPLPPIVPGPPTQSHLKRVNWEKLHGTEGTIWKEVLCSLCNTITTGYILNMFIAEWFGRNTRVL